MTRSTDGPRVAVVIPCFNDGPLLVEAIASIEEPEPIELVVVDDGSTDAATLEILDRFGVEGIRVLRHDVNRGIAQARNTGLGATSAHFLFPLDADDLAVAGALTQMAERLDAVPEAVVGYGDYLEFGTRELVRAVPPRIDPYRLAYVNEYPVSALYRRTLLEEVGGWRGPRRGYEDWSLWMAIAERCRRGGVYLGPDELSYRRRIHGERMLNRSKRVHRELYVELRASHPRLFSELRLHKQRSDLSLWRKILYPLLYGGRRRFGFEQHVKNWLDRAGIWTLRG